MAFASVKNAQKKANKKSSSSTTSVGDVVNGKKVTGTRNGVATRFEGERVDKSDGPSRGSNQQVNDINQARYDNIQSGLDPYSGAGRKGQVITSSALAPTPAINIPATPATDNAGTNLMTQFAGMANAGTGNAPATPTGDGATEPSSDLTRLIKSITEANDFSTEKIYKKSEKESGVQPAQQLVNTYQSQLNAIVAKAEADKLALVGQGRGVEERVIGGQQAQIDREAAIQSLPIAAQLSAAQGDLAAAKEHLNTLFTMRVQDAQNKAARQTKIAELVYGYATDQQKLALDAKKTQDDRAYDMKLKLMDDAKDYANMALDAGQTSLFASIMRLNPEDPNYATNIASYASGIQASGGSKKTSLIGTPERQLLNGAGYNDASIDHIAQGISDYGFDDVYAQEKADGATKTQLDAISKVYNRAPTRTEAEIKSAVTQKFAADSLSSLYTEKELHDLAKKAGFGGFNLDSKSTEIEKYLNSPKAREDYIALLIEQERKAGRLAE